MTVSEKTHPELDGAPRPPPPDAFGVVCILRVLLQGSGRSVESVCLSQLMEFLCPQCRWRQPGRGVFLNIGDFFLLSLWGSPMGRRAHVGLALTVFGFVLLGC